MRISTLMPVGLSLRTVILLLALSCFLFAANAQGVAINDAGTAPDPSAILDLSSSNQGFLMPRMNTIDRILISSPAEGLMVYDQETNSPWIRSQSVWQELVPIPAGSILLRSDRNDTRMTRAGFGYVGEMPLNNGGNIRGWLTPYPTLTGAPGASANHIHLWTGTDALFWGGTNGTNLNTGARYDPVGDSWTPISVSPVPSGLALYTWTHSQTEIFIWGGSQNFFTSLNNGYRYNWGSDSWTTMSTTNAPSGRMDASSAWTGSELFVFGGRELQGFFSVVLGDGGLYDPASDSWTALPTLGAPSPRMRANIHVSGTKVVVWGGTDPSGTPLYDGAIYDTQTGSWGPMNLTNAPSSLTNYEMLGWDENMLVYGLATGNGVEGAIYDVDTDSWTTMSVAGAPERFGFSLVWTGTEVVLWGGRASTTYYSDGAIYRPDLDSWAGFSDANEPTGRLNHTAVWSGSEMIILGGQGSGNTYIQEPTVLGTPTALTYFLYRKN